MKKCIKAIAGLLTALSIIISTSSPVFAADVEIQGEGTTPKSQSIQVSASVSSVYAVTMPATIEMEYRTVTNNNGTETRTDSGYFCDVEIGAAGKILSTQTLKMSLDTANDTLTGATTSKTIKLGVVTAGCKDDEMFDRMTADNFTSFERFNLYYNVFNWTSAAIGTADYDGISLSNCNYVYRTLTIGFNESALQAADAYTGTITINFGLQ